MFVMVSFKTLVERYTPQLLYTAHRNNDIGQRRLNLGQISSRPLLEGPSSLLANALQVSADGDMRPAKERRNTPWPIQAGQ